LLGVALSVERGSFLLDVPCCILHLAQAYALIALSQTGRNDAFDRVVRHP
jgi:hypothetical protein